MLGNSDRKLIENSIKCSIKYNGMTREQAVAKLVREWENRVRFEEIPLVWTGPEGSSKTAWEGCNAKRLQFCQQMLETMRIYK